MIGLSLVLAAAAVGGSAANDGLSANARAWPGVVYNCTATRWSLDGVEQPMKVALGTEMFGSPGGERLYVRTPGRGLYDQYLDEPGRLTLFGLMVDDQDPAKPYLSSIVAVVDKAKLTYWQQEDRRYNRQKVEWRGRCVVAHGAQPRR